MHFDSKAKNWDTDINKIKRASIFAKEITDFIQPKKSATALEFGCGTGLLSFELKDAFNSITLVDNSVGMIDVLKEKIEKHKIKNFNPLTINLLEDKFNLKSVDVIYTLMTLHHINDLDAIFKIFNTLLNTNGYLCIADLVKEDGSFHPKEMNFDGHTGFDKDKLSSILLKNGFKIKYYTICYEVEKVRKNQLKKYPLFLLIAKKVA
ncbi:class I SAM-dependent methyltransferase [Lutibacter sp. B1]|uniref:class I SAM-dependent DNA methyltransferase n=1 Tax=Lutibacter sp. B1 TaxID=2725996 RepID=UPI0014578EAC|nr:class I SAM-dependent methyltransferase [Lutibacter sp. B1]NLP56921.1 class I SAM-dependent methyltransferase [Lutibacter sp. B1]